MAQVGMENPEKDGTELEKLNTFAADDILKKVAIWDIITTQELMQIAIFVVGGEIKALKSTFNEAVRLLRDDSEIENQLNYNEPPDWFFPVRRNLGSLLLKTGQYAEAQEIYRKDLAKFLDTE